MEKRLVEWATCNLVESRNSKRLNLYILRHAKAEERSARFAKDSERPLTFSGEKEMRCVAKAMRRIDLQFDLILSSPFVRARRTAEIAAQIFESKNLVMSEHLESGADPQRIIQQINDDHPSVNDLLLVGHEPFLSNLVAVLCSGSETFSLKLKKGGLCKLTVTTLKFGRCATMEWLIQPKQLMQMERK